MVNYNSQIAPPGFPGTEEGPRVDPLMLLFNLLSPPPSQEVHPLIAQMLNPNRRIQQINEAVEGPPQTRSIPSGVPEAVPGTPQRSTAELLRAIDAMAIKPTEAGKVAKPFIKVVPITVRTKDGEELKYKDSRTGKIYDHDPND